MEMYKLPADILKILLANPDCALTGAHNLLYQNKKIRRKPVDIDIYCPSGVFNLVPGMSVPENNGAEKDYSQADNIENRNSYLLHGIKVDVFIPIVQKTISPVIINGIKCMPYMDTLKSKLGYTNSFGKSSLKHKMDLMYFLLMN